MFYFASAVTEEQLVLSIIIIIIIIIVLVHISHLTFSSMLHD
jgi:hypothetical protein